MLIKRIIIIVIMTLGLISMHTNVFAYTTEEQEENDSILVDVIKNYGVPILVIAVLWGTLENSSSSLSENINEKGELSLFNNLSFKIDYAGFNNSEPFDHMDFSRKSFIPYPTMTLKYSW